MDTFLQLEIFFNIILAGALGSVVGFERELANKTAGLRTHIYITTASAALVSLSAIIVDSFESVAQQFLRVDPISIIHAIIIGVSFIGRVLY